MRIRALLLVMLVGLPGWTMMGCFDYGGQPDRHQKPIGPHALTSGAVPEQPSLP